MIATVVGMVIVVVTVVRAVNVAIVRRAKNAAIVVSVSRVMKRVLTVPSSKVPVTTPKLSSNNSNKPQPLALAAACGHARC